MNTNILIISLLVLIIVAVIIGFVLMNKKDTQPTQQPTQSTPPPTESLGNHLIDVISGWFKPKNNGSWSGTQAEHDQISNEFDDLINSF